MSFLQAGALWALPLILLPLLIHWLYRRRHQTIEWPAMLFLRRAAEHRRSPSKWRRRLILATRMAIVAAIVIAFARPLSTGQFGLAASRIGDQHLAILLIDRSPNMQRRTTGGITRQQAALENVAATLNTLGQPRVIVIDSVNPEPTLLDSVSALTNDRWLHPADSQADLPYMLEQAVQHIRQQRHATADVWICSDHDARAWRPEDSRWKTLSDTVSNSANGVRFHRLKFPESDQANASVTVSQLQPATDEPTRGIKLSVDVHRDRIAADRDPPAADDTIALQINLGNTSETVKLQLRDHHGSLVDHFVPILNEMDVAYGSVSIPADVNPADDRWYFVAKPAYRPRFAILTETSSPALAAAAEVIGEVALDSQSRLATNRAPQAIEDWLDVEADVRLWQGPLPSDPPADRLRQLSQSGESIVFFPPTQQGEQKEQPTTFAGVAWKPWVRDDASMASYDDYRFQLDAYRPISGETVARATLQSQEILIGKRRIGQGNVWFCGADLQDDAGAFVRDGVALYALLHEAATASRTSRDHSASLTAGQVDASQDSATPWNPAWSTPLLRHRNEPMRWSEYGHHAGVYQLKNRPEDPGRLQAINRPHVPADQRLRLDDETIASLLPQASWNLVSIDETGSTTAAGFVREIWSSVWSLVILGLLLEAVLSLPRSPEARS
jgi:hypothetical protein